MQYKIRYFRDKRGKSQVLEFIKKLGPKFEAKYSGYVDQLKVKGPLLPRPIADTLRDGIHELRFDYR